MRTKQVLVVAVLLCLGILAGSAQALAAGAPKTIETKISFEFQVGDQMFPAGMYHFEMQGGAMLVRSMDRKHSATVPVITQLGSTNKAGAGLVFDKTNGKHTLSEVWLSESDGLLVAATAEQHQHDIVK